jgi:CheY-like chemotaxis protein
MEHGMFSYDIIRASDGSQMPPSRPGNLAGADGATASTLSRVLVVDDERLIADTVAQILNIHGYDAFTAYSGPDALKLAARFQPDYLVSDVMMPVMNGVDLAMQIEKLLPAVKVLLFSGQAGTSALMEQYRLDGSNYKLVAKPIHPERLVQLLREMGSR